MHCMLIILYCVKSPSPTEKSRADVCLRAHVDDEDPLTRVGLRIVGGEVVGQCRLSDTTLSKIHTWSPSDNITIEHPKGLQSLSRVDFGNASLRLIVGPIIVIIVVIILDVSKTSQNNQSRWFKKIITPMVMLTP